MHQSATKVNNTAHSLLLACLLLLGGCTCSAPDPARDDTPTSGSILILADADCRPVVEKELLVFSDFYPKADIRVRYLHEAEMLQAMLNDSVRCVVTAVEPGGAQQAYFNKRNISAPMVPAYRSGIALVVNKNSPLQHLRLDQVAALLGKVGTLQVTTDAEQIPRWDSLTALFAGSGSGVARQLMDTLGMAKLRAQALPDAAAVVHQAARNDRVIGFLPFEAISDLDDPAMRGLRDQVRLLPIARTAADPPVSLNQTTIGDGSYPLPRTVRMVLTEGKSGLGTGFVSFVANIKGQRIILKLGLVPIRVPERNIQIVHQ
ncbi:MAG: substrate-binding domain-containing protein [Flavobacteriales bacterium]|nr:substrate-binding domain-containing protein [Flavobacteriales bacterium]